MTSFKRNQLHLAAIALAGLLGLAGCGGTNTEAPAKSDTTAVAAWNDIAIQAVQKFKETDPAGGLPPYVEARLYAMAFVAAHDALNMIENRYVQYTGDDPDGLAAYARGGRGVATTSPDAAVAAAVRDVLVAQLPPMTNFVNGQYEAALASIPQSATKTNGIALGQQVAATVNSLREGDGSATADGPYEPGSAPGNYRFTPPFDAAPFNGFAAAVNWRKVRPFVLARAAQFLSPPPYRVSEAAYAEDFNEVKALGGATSSARTADQSQIAKFWIENSPLGWNRIAMTVARERGLTGWDVARLAALVQLAVADAYIASIDTKYTYALWRPITAIRLAADDENPATAPDPEWQPYDPVTPPVPEYNSAHSAAGGAAAAVLRGALGTDAVSFTQTSTSLPGVTRSYSRFSQAADENGLSRIYVGYHFRLAVTEGRKQGEAIGELTLQTKLRSLK
jgi:hypothetical protein